MFTPTRIFRISIACAVLLPSAAAMAYDKPMLDMLVDKNILSRAEAVELAKESAGVVCDGNRTESLKISSRFQLQFEDLSSKLFSGVGAPLHGDPKTGFIVRRMFLQADASLGAGWKARMSVDLARTRLNSVLTDNYVSKSIDGGLVEGTLFLGYMKPYFCHEDVVSSFSQSAIERSTASMYWTGAANGRRLGIGNRYAGIRWNGEVRRLKGMSYTIAVTNSFQLNPDETEDLEYDYTDNHLAYWLNLHYDIKRENFNLKFGVYTMYSSTANKKMGQGAAAAVYSVDPYFTGNWGELFFWGEYLASAVDDGRALPAGGWRGANPYGVNVCVEYRFDVGEFGKLAPVFRYSWLDTDGRGLNVSDAVRQAGNVGGVFNTAHDFYAGLNWYLDGDNLKIQIGYNYVQFSGEIDANLPHAAEGHALRLQLQVKL